MIVDIFLLGSGSCSFQNSSKKSSSTLLRATEKAGTTNQDTRKTVTRIAGDLNIPIDKIDVILNHSIDGIMKHYVEEQQQERDVYHIHILQEFGIIELLRNLVKYFEFHKKKQIVNGKEHSFIPQSKSFWNKWTSARRKNLEIDQITQFTISDEMESQRLKAKYAQGKSDFNPATGEIEFKEVDFKDYPDRLKELFTKRERISEARIIEQTL